MGQSTAKSKKWYVLLAKSRISLPICTVWSVCCWHEETVGPLLPIEQPEKTDQTAWMRMLMCLCLAHIIRFKCLGSDLKRITWCFFTWVTCPNYAAAKFKNTVWIIAKLLVCSWKKFLPRPSCTPKQSQLVLELNVPYMVIKCSL